MLARMVTHALVGLDARRVEVEAHLQRGVPGFARCTFARANAVAETARKRTAGITRRRIRRLDMR